jgi:hypothetical protein
LTAVREVLSEALVVTIVVPTKYPRGMHEGIYTYSDIWTMIGTNDMKILDQ